MPSSLTLCLGGMSFVQHLAVSTKLIRIDECSLSVLVLRREDACDLLNPELQIPNFEALPLGSCWYGSAKLHHL